MIKKLIEKHGAINLAMAVTTLLSLVGLLVGVIYVNASQRISILETKSDVFISDISSLKVISSDTKGKVDAIYSGLLNGGLINKQILGK